MPIEMCWETRKNSQGDEIIMTKLSVALAAAATILISGCAGELAFSQPVSYSGNGATIRGSSGERPSAIIMASGNARATTVMAVAQAHATVALANADARRITARAQVTETRARRLEQLWVQTAECRHRGYSLQDCLGPQALALLSMEDTSYLMGLGGMYGGYGYGGNAGLYYGMPVAGGQGGTTSATGSPDLGARVDRLESETHAAVEMFHGYVTDGSSGGAR